MYRAPSGGRGTPPAQEKPTSFADWLERDRSDPTVPTPTADEFADAQARLDEGEELPGDEALTLAYNERVLIPAQRKYEATVNARAALDFLRQIAPSGTVYLPTVEYLADALGWPVKATSEAIRDLTVSKDIELVEPGVYLIL